LSDDIFGTSGNDTFLIIGGIKYIDGREGNKIS
jgi:hypothetical protein